MKVTRTTIKCISMIIAIIMVFVTIPTNAISLSVNSSENTEQITIADDNDFEQADIFIVEEDVSKRGMFEKHYVCSDGSYVSVTYPEAVHYLDDTGMWVDVDQSLSYDVSTGLYKNVSSDFNVEFAENASLADMVSVRYLCCLRR